MKKSFKTAIFTLVTALGFAQEPTDVLPNSVILEPKPLFTSLKEKVSSPLSFGYLRMGVSDSNLRTTDLNVSPGFGIGYRVVSGPSAIDLSASFNRKEINTALGDVETTYLYTLPKANYFYYLSAASDNSLYAGGGLAWGGVRTENERFVGLIPNLAVGYELNRAGALRSFIQVDLSQPLVAAVQQGALPRTYAEVSVGAGF